MTLKNYLLIFGLTSALVFTSCSKEEETTDDNSAPPKIEVKGSASSGNIIDLPQNASTANNGQFQGVTSNINTVGQFITLLNSVPENATTDRSTNSGVTYNWSVSNNGITIEYWYTVEENGANYNITYDLAYTSVANPELSFARTTLLTGWIAQNGQAGDLTINYNVLSNTGDFNLNYHYTWNTEANGDLNVVADFNLGADSQTANVHYVAKVYAAGGGYVDYTYTNTNQESIAWHYEWNADWTVVSWTYTINGSEDTNYSGTWTATA